MATTVNGTNNQATTAGSLGSTQNSTGSKLSSATTNKSVADQASSTMSQIQSQVAALAQQQKQSKLQTRDFEKNTNDVSIDTRMTARDIGTLRHDKSRLNVFSSLTAGDNVDFFSFKMASKSTMKFSVLTADGNDEKKLRFQVVNQSGRIIADSDPKAGDAKKVYDQMKAGTYTLAAGTYALRITRADDSKQSRATAYNYAVQFSSGLHTDDYDTIEKGIDKSKDAFGFAPNAMVNTLTSSLGASVSYLQSLPKLGTAGTDKLSGMLLNKVF